VGGVDVGPMPFLRQQLGDTVTVDYVKTPFQWFGGKADAAEHVWRLLGDPPHYVEPFFGGLSLIHI
jgi:hypothetical protein